MMFKKRTQVFYGNMNDERHKERRVLRKRETLPWILEDGGRKELLLRVCTVPVFVFV